MGELFVKTERGIDPTFPIVIDSDDFTEPLAIVKPAPKEADKALYPSPEGTPPFSCGISLYSTIAEDLGGPDADVLDNIYPESAEQGYFMSDWVNQSLSPTPGSGVESLDLEVIDSTCFAHRIKSPPSPAPPFRDDYYQSLIGLSALKTTRCSVSSANDRDANPVSKDSEKLKVRIRLTYNKRPKIVL